MPPPRGVQGQVRCGPGQLDLVPNLVVTHGRITGIWLSLGSPIIQVMGHIIDDYRIIKFGKEHLRSSPSVHHDYDLQRCFCMSSILSLWMTIWHKTAKKNEGHNVLHYLDGGRKEQSGCSGYHLKICHRLV